MTQPNDITPPPRDERIMAAVIDKVTDRVTHTIINSIRDRGGNHTDVCMLLGHINAVTLATLVPDSDKAKVEAMADLIMEFTRKVNNRIATMDLLKKGNTVKGLRP